MKTRSIGAVLALHLSCAGAMPQPSAPPPVAIAGETVEVSEPGHRVELQPGDLAGRWTFMGTTTSPAGKPQAIFEDFSTMRGGLVVVDEQGARQEFPKSLEPTLAGPKALYRGHSFAEVLGSDHDLLGGEILAQKGDPDFAEVAACLAPIVKMETYTFVGTRESPDKIGVAYGGRTANFDPAVLVPAIAQVRADGRVLDGLVGGWLPVLRFVYPEQEGDWTELVLFAPRRSDLDNPRIQPVWYRVCRVEGNQLKWTKYFDSYPPFPPRADSRPAAGFYHDLLALRQDWASTLAAGMQIDLPDARLADQARHSLVRAMVTRVGSFPKYGVLDRNYGGAEHDGFQDTFNVDTTAMLAWGLADQAHDYLDNYFTHFVRDDGAILYRGPETGQYGRMLTVLAEYANVTGDDALLLKHRPRIEAVTRLLLALRRTAQALPRESPAYGLISGWCEADSCLEPDPGRSMQPYFSNSCEAVRGWGDLGAAWERIGQKARQPDLVAAGTALRHEATALRADLQTAIGRSLLAHTTPASLPAIAGATEPFDVAARRDNRDPQFRAYRAYAEMLFSGCLSRAEVDTIVRYREAHRDILLGVPAVYGYDSRELGGFLSYGHAYGLLQHDFIREYLLELYSLSAHQYTRGTWTAPETRRLNPADAAAPYCVPAQLAVPLLVRWLLAFEDPVADTLWLCKAVPRDWLKDGSTVAASAIPTRWGKVSFQVRSHLAQDRIEVAVDLPPAGGPREIQFRLRVPESRPIASVQLDGKPWANYDPQAETIALPASAAGKVRLTVHYR